MIKFLISIISNAIGFSKSESRGTLMLIFVIIIGFSVKEIALFYSRPTIKEEIEDSKELEAWINEVESSIELRKDENSFDKSAYLPIKKNYLEKDKAKTQKSDAINKPSIDSFKTPIIVSDLNTADADELQKVKGIGPAFSERIIKFRSRLGGFASIDQLNEVYGLKPETIEETKKHFTVKSPPKRININNDSAKVLARHPYISYDLAWVILNYRKQNGNIESLDDLKEIKAIDSITLLKLRPYME